MGNLLSKSTLASLALIMMMPMTGAYADSSAEILRRPGHSDGGNWNRGRHNRGRHDGWNRRNRGGIGFWIGIGGGHRNAWTCTYAARTYSGRVLRFESGAHQNRYSAQNRAQQRCLNNGYRSCYLVGCYRY